MINSICDDKSDASIVKLSPTAIAAININGQTIPSFFRFPPNIFDPSNSEYIKKDKRLVSGAPALENLDHVIYKNKNILFEELNIPATNQKIIA